jgi:hypothetical protein
MEIFLYMISNKPIVVCIDTTRIRREVMYHCTLNQQDMTTHGLSADDVLHLLSCLAQFSDDEDAINIMAEDIAGGMELECHREHHALVSLLIDASKFLRKDLGMVARLHPGREIILDEIKGNSAYFLLE